MINDIALGQKHMCIAFQSGVLRCWGWGMDGQLGSGSTNSIGDQLGEVPAPDVDSGGKVVQIATGVHHTCERLDSGSVKCWGLGTVGRLGYGNTESLGTIEGDLPTPDVDVGADVLDVATRIEHTCVLMTGGTARCWGQGKSGRLGYGNEDILTSPNQLDVPGVNGVTQLAVGYEHTCVLDKSGDVRCWGLNNFGQLGLGHTDYIGDGPGEMPPPPTSLGGVVMQLAAGGYHNCALMQNGEVRCWGHGAYGRIGNNPNTFVGDAPGEMPPVPVVLGGAAIHVVAGFEHSCALMKTGGVKCWGHGLDGLLGYANEVDIKLPDQFPPGNVDLGGNGTMLWSDGGFSTCALLVNNTLRCWGFNDRGQLGYGHTHPIGDNESPGVAGPVPF